ncbi:MAG: hypothetical protein V2B19_09955 [Pseudomonadota bacterium]
MKSESHSLELIREMRFESEDFFDQNKMLHKLDLLIQAWGEELLRSRHIDAIPDSEHTWLEVLERDIHWTDLDDQWDVYLVGCLIFFVLMREDIKRDFLLQPYNVQGQRLERWLWRLKRYMTPLTREVVTRFCLCYSLSQERLPIRVRYKG